MEANCMASEALTQDFEHEQPQTVDSPEEGGKREFSSIKFPYLPLGDAIIIAKGVHDCGSTCEVDQLGAHMKLKPDTGGFRLKMGVAKMFGLVAHAQRTVTLTPLGNRICDPQQEQAAKAEAFLNIPLYQKVYEQFKGGTLPPLNGLEAAIVTMGVAPKQKTVARQVMMRSAESAGFLWSGNNRLVFPKGIAPNSGAATAETKTGSHEHSPEKPPHKHGGGGDGPQHPFIDGLLRTLPEPQSLWPIEGRKRWLLAACSVFDLIYEGDDETASLRVEIAKG